MKDRKRKRSESNVNSAPPSTSLYDDLFADDDNDTDDDQQNDRALHSSEADQEDLSDESQNESGEIASVTSTASQPKKKIKIPVSSSSKPNDSATDDNDYDNPMDIPMAPSAGTFDRLNKEAINEDPQPEEPARSKADPRPAKRRKINDNSKSKTSSINQKTESLDTSKSETFTTTSIMKMPSLNIGANPTLDRKNNLGNIQNRPMQVTYAQIPNPPAPVSVPPTWQPVHTMPLKDDPIIRLINDFKSVCLGPNYADLIIEKWNNRLLSAVLTGQPVNFGSRQQPDLRIFPIDLIRLADAFKSVLRCRRSEIVLEMLDGETSLRAYFTGQRVNFGSIQQPDWRIISDQELIDNFYLTLATTQASIFRNMDWDKNARLCNILKCDYDCSKLFLKKLLTGNDIAIYYDSEFITLYLDCLGGMAISVICGVINNGDCTESQSSFLKEKLREVEKKASQNSGVSLAQPQFRMPTVTSSSQTPIYANPIPAPVIVTPRMSVPTTVMPGGPSQLFSAPFPQSSGRTAAPIPIIPVTNVPLLAPLKIPSTVPLAPNIPAAQVTPTITAAANTDNRTNTQTVVTNNQEQSSNTFSTTQTDFNFFTFTGDKYDYSDNFDFFSNGPKSTQTNHL
jgi:hypothetical protein